MCRVERREFGAQRLGRIAAPLRHSFAGAAGDAARNDNELVLAYVSLGYTPEEEREADDIGLLLLCRGGWAPEAYEQMIDGGARTAALQKRGEAVRTRVDALPAAAADWLQPPV